MSPRQHTKTSLEKPQDFGAAIKKTLRYLAKERVALVFVALFAALSAVFNIIGPKILSGAITELYVGLVAKMQGGSINFEKIAQILIGLLALYLVSLAFAAIMGMLMNKITQRTGYKLRQQISDKIHRMPFKRFDGTSVGDVLSRITNDVDTLTQSLNQSATQLISSLTSLIGSIVMMLIISPTMTLIALVMLPISVGIIALIMKFSQKHFFRQQRYLGDANGQVEEDISGHNIVKLYGHEEESIAEFSKTNDALYTSAWKSQFFSGLMQPIISFASNLGYVAVAIFGGIFAFRRLITVGDIQAFIQYVRNFTQPMTMLAQIFNMLQSMAAASERVFAFLEEEEESDDSAVIASEDGKASSLRGLQETASRGNPEVIIPAVEFKNVRFGYTPETPIIKNLSERVGHGETVAIVGPTGAGKTTLVKLLMRFYDVQGGSILVDGIDIREIPRAVLRENFGMVLQDTWLFRGTIMENIKYGRLGATDEEAIEAAKAAHVHHFITTLPDGYDTLLSEEADNISAGQKQLLTIARAILANSPILILDEATSSVDTRTEEIIQKAMANLKKGRTSFVIAHRLSTIKSADTILLLDKGDVAEQGTHEELLAKGGFYSELWKSQFEVA